MFGFAKNSYLLSTHCSLESIIIDARGSVLGSADYGKTIKRSIKLLYWDEQAGRRGRREIERWA